MSTAGILDRLSTGVGNSEDYAALRMSGSMLFVNESASLGGNAVTIIGHAEIEMANLDHWKGKLFPVISRISTRLGFSDTSEHLIKGHL